MSPPKGDKLRLEHSSTIVQIVRRSVALAPSVLYTKNYSRFNIRILEFRLPDIVLITDTQICSTSNVSVASIVEERE